MTTGIASVQLDNPPAELFQIQFPNGNYYTDGQYHAWPMTSAKHIARNVAMKRKVTVNLVKIKEVIDNDSPYDRIVNYVDTLKGAQLAAIIKQHELPRGNDSVASKRVRLITHLTKCSYSHA